MLVMSRRERQAVVINDEIVVTVIEISGNIVKLGFQAPTSIPIHRAEIQARIQQEKGTDNT